jgi:hypothetical protein
VASLVKSGVWTKAWSAILCVDIEVPVLHPLYPPVKRFMRLFLLLFNQHCCVVYVFYKHEQQQNVIYMLTQTGKPVLLGIEFKINGVLFFRAYRYC